MKILVCARQATTVPGPAVLLKDGSDVDPHFTLRRIGEADEHAVEAALQLAERQAGSSVVAVSVGPDAYVDALRKCLAMGAHRAVRVWRDDLALHDPVGVARAIAHQVRAEAADVVLCGVQSTDAGQQVTGAAVAACVGWPCVTAVTQLEMIWEQRIARVHRDAGAGRTEVVEVELPAVFTVQTGINTPRAPTFKGVMNAKKAPIVLVDPGPDTRERLRALGVAVPPRVQRRLHVIDGGPREVAARLRELLREG